MTNYLHIIVTFICVLFLYIHIQFQLSPSEERQIFVIDQPVNIQIEEIFELKQPIIMKLLHADIINELTMEKIYEECQHTDISIYDNSGSISHAHILSSTTACKNLFNTDKNSRYYTEKNAENISTLPSNSIIKKINTSHRIFTPPLCSRQKNDILFGSDNVTTIPQHSIMFRNIFTVTSGTVDVCLIHPDDFAKNNITINNEYTDMTFFIQSGFDLWNNDNPDIIKATIHTGETMSIPPYWLYSFKYKENAVIGSSSFNSYITEIAIIKHTLLYWATKFTRPTNVIYTTTKKEDETHIVNEKIDNTPQQNNEETTKNIVEINIQPKQDETDKTPEQKQQQEDTDKTPEQKQQQEDTDKTPEQEQKQKQKQQSTKTTSNNPYLDVMVPLHE